MKLLHVAGVAALCVLFSSVALADSIPLNNPSFQNTSGNLTNTDFCTGCHWGIGGVPGWTSGGTNYTGQQEQGTAAGDTVMFNSFPDGPTVAYANAGGTLSQVVPGSEIAGGTYTLTVGVGQRADLSGTFDPIVEAIVNSPTNPTSPTIYQATGVTPLPGDWSNYSVTFTVPTGDSIEILLGDLGIQADFDNVQLCSVPEPATDSMLILGMLGLLAFGWRRKQAGTALS